MSDEESMVVIQDAKLLSRFWSLFHFDKLVGQPITVMTVSANQEEVSATFILSEAYTYRRTENDVAFTYLRLFSASGDNPRLRVELKIKGDEVSLCSFASYPISGTIGSLQTNLTISKV